MSKINKLHCNTCNHDTNHKLLAKSTRTDVEFVDEENDIVFSEDFQYSFWACLGCDTALIQERYNHSSMTDEEGNDFYHYTYFPERTNSIKRKAKKFIHINKNLNSTYNEIIQASNLNLFIVSAMGIRALLEGICVEEHIDDEKAYQLTKKIELLQTESKIPPNIIDGLNSLKFIGDDAAHRLSKTSERNIRIAIDLLEALLTHLYEAKFDLDQKAKIVCDANINNKST